LEIESATTIRQKAAIKEELADLGITLPEYLYAGATTAQLRPLVTLANNARERSIGRRV
jgi:hypothetical protein